MVGGNLEKKQVHKYSCVTTVFWMPSNVVYYHHQFNTHECSMNNKIHEKAHTIIQKESTKKIQKDE